MAAPGPIVMIEDDKDDQELYKEAIHELDSSREIIFFKRTDVAFHYLKTTPQLPFLIFCDINLPGQNGLNFKKNIDSDPQLRQQSIPFVFLSTNVGAQAVIEAYSEMTIQGFFQKPASFREIKEMFASIMSYWKLCKHPNSQ